MDNYYKSKKFKETLSRCEDFLSNKSTDIPDSDEFADVAQYYHNIKDDKKALSIIDAALEIYPGSVAPLSFKARYALLIEQDPKKADRFAEKISDKHDPDYVLLKAEIMVVQAKADEADKYLEQAYIDYYDDDYYDDMPLDVATLFADYEETDYANKWLMRSDETDEPEYLETKARIMISEGKDKESEEIINELINRDPYNPTYWNLMAASKMFEGDIHESITSSDYALAVNPDDPDAIYNKANGLLGLKNYEEAEKLFDKYIQLEPKKDLGYLMSAIAIVSQGRYQEALPRFKKALEINKKTKGSWQTQAEIIYQMSFIENYLGHYNKVHDYLDQLSEIYEDNLNNDMDEMGMRLAEVDCAHGHIYLEEEKIGEAIDWFDQAVTDSGGATSIYVKIAASAYECGYVQYAYNILHELIYENRVYDRFGMKYLALCCEELGKPEEKKWVEEKIGKNITSQEQ